MCVIGGAEEFGPAYRRFYGSAAHGDSELALFKAFAEALQSRLTVIAGVRADILPSYYTLRPAAATAVNESAPTGTVAWEEAAPLAHGWEHIVAGLARRGYRSVEHPAELH